MWWIERGRKLLDLTPAEWKILLKAFLLLPLIRLALQFYCLKHVQIALSDLAGLSKKTSLVPGATVDYAYSVGRCVRMAGNSRLCKSSCLAQALCVWFLLKQYGIVSDLRIGVKGSGNNIVAHAWIEQAGRVINEQANVHEQFAVFDPAINYSITGLQ